VRFWESQHDGWWRNFCRFFGNQARTVFRKVSTKNARYVKERAAAADQTLIMGAVTDNITFST
jgi:hypothetical protein